MEPPEASTHALKASRGEIPAEHEHTEVRKPIIANNPLYIELLQCRQM